MYCINNMSIRGIRAFGPDEADRQVIQFEQPLTLLVGPNGAGKTTIIECLKYATTGVKPVNSQGGFVHDLNVFQKDEVRGEVHLEIQNRQGKKILVKRNLKSTKKENKISENIVDVVIAKERYTKAMENIFGIQKELKENVEKHKQNLKYLQAYDDKAKSLQQKETENKEKLEVAKKNSQKVKDMLLPIQKEINQLTDKQSDIITTEKKLEAMKSQQKQMLKEKENLRKRIKEEFDGTDEQLNDEKREMEQVINTKQKSLNKWKKDNDRLLKNLDDLSKKKSELFKKQGKLQIEIENAATKKKTRAALMHEYKKLYELSMCDLGGDKITEGQVNTFVSMFEDHINAKDKSLQSLKASLTAQERHKENELKLVRQNKTKKMEGCRLKQEELEKQEIELHEVKKHLRCLQVNSDSDEKLTDLQVKLETAEQKLEELKISPHVALIHKNLNKSCMNREQLKKQIKELENEIMLIVKSTETRTQIEIKQKEIRKKETINKQMMQKHYNVLQEVGIISSTSSMFPDKSRMAQWVDEKENEIKCLQTELDNKKVEKAKLVTEHDGVTQSFNIAVAKQESLKEKSSKIFGSQDLENGLVQLKKEIKKMQKSMGLTDGMQFIYKKFINQLKPKGQHKKTDIPCPLCQRPFEESWKVDELMEKLQMELEHVPKICPEKLSRKQNDYRVLEANKSKQTELEREIPELHQTLIALKKKINDVSEFKSDLRKVLVCLKADESKAKSCLVDVTLIDKSLLDIRNLGQELHELEPFISKSPSKTLDEANAEKDKLSRVLEKVTRDITRRQLKIQEHANAKNEQQQEVNSIQWTKKLKEVCFVENDQGRQAEKLQLKSNLQKYQQLKERRERLSNDILKSQREIDKLQTSLVPLEREEKTLETEKHKLIEDNKELLGKESHQLQNIKSKKKNFMDLQKDIKLFEASDKEGQLQRTKEDIGRLETIEQLQDDINTHENTLRELKDNIDLRELDCDIRNVNDEIEQLTYDIYKMDPVNIEDALDTLKDLRESLSEKHQVSKTEEALCEQQLSNTRTELDSDEYKNAERNYRQCFVDFVIDDVASEDLLKYYKALDHAIMRFHKIKMDEINKIIRDLWQETYNGKDIEYIKICDDTERPTHKSRRVFNYRVVMHSGDTEMDMRGRCSAGQKVLASLVIRLALAETFCTNCGILALDEPTTNLDRDNIDKLAQALINIIESRSKQRNFQLLVITHDEYFVEQLGRSRFADSLLRITKDEHGKTRVARSRISSLEQ